MSKELLDRAGQGSGGDVRGAASAVRTDQFDRLGRILELAGRGRIKRPGYYQS